MLGFTILLFVLFARWLFVFGLRRFQIEDLPEAERAEASWLSANIMAVFAALFILEALELFLKLV